jgi:cutinase
VVFGDPDKDQPIENISSDDILTFCAEGDLICQGEPIVLIPHLSYGANAPQAADFVASKVA